MSRQNVGREQAGEAEPAFEAARLWLQSRLPSWFSAFSILQDFFFFPPLVGNVTCKTGRGFAYMYILRGWEDTSNQPTF